MNSQRWAAYRLPSHRNTSPALMAGFAPDSVPMNASAKFWPVGVVVLLVTLPLRPPSMATEAPGSAEACVSRGGVCMSTGWGSIACTRWTMWHAQRRCLVRVRRGSVRRRRGSAAGNNEQQQQQQQEVELLCHLPLPRPPLATEAPGCRLAPSHELKPPTPLRQLQFP